MIMNKQQLLRITLAENQFIIPSYQQYAGISGLHDYGIVGTRIKNNFLNQWRDFFLKSDEIEEIETPTIMPYDLLKASGHVDRFTDFVTYDQNNTCFRADHLLKNYFKDNNMIDMIDTVDTFTEKELEENINKYNIIKSAKVTKKNLMFEIPNNDTHPYYLRPELAQGIFCNFKQINQFLKKDLPFGIAQVGSSYRKEISPVPFTRLRSFTQAEIEFFVDPNNKQHPKFTTINNISIPLLTSEMQLNNIREPIIISVGNAVEKKLISHEIMGYFLAKIYLFALNIGLHKDKIRFRQHLSHEMAHYASECWDLECFVNSSWLECVGVADRGSYDLRAHSKQNSELTFRQELETPIYKKYLKLIINKKIIYQVYGNLIEQIVKELEKLSQEQLKSLQCSESINVQIMIDDVILNKQITSDMFKIVEEETKLTSREIYPHVIEPSFGVDRLIYAIIEQNFWYRPEDNKRWVLSLPQILSPYQIAVYQLFNKPELLSYVDNVKTNLKSAGYSVYTDKSSTSIGKRYVRSDEMGIKYVITIDPGSLTDHCVTIRERDTTKQIRIPSKDLITELIKL